MYPIVQTQSESLTRLQNSRSLASSDEAEYQQYMNEHAPSSEGGVLSDEEKTSRNNSFADHLAEIPPSIGTGLLKATQELGNFAIDGSNAINQWFVDNNMGGIAGKTDREGFDFANDDNYVFQPKTMTGQMISGITQFAAPMGAINKTAKGIQVASKVGRFAKAGALGAAVDFAAFDPHEERFSNLMQRFPALQNPVSAYLAANPKDTKAEGRFKNALEGIGLGVASEMVVSVFKAVRHNRYVSNIKKDVDDVAKIANDKGVELEAKPEKKLDAEGKPVEVEAVDEVPQEVKQIKEEVKAKRPTQQEAPEIEVDKKAEYVAIAKTTEEEAAAFVRGFEDVSTKGQAININFDKVQTSNDVKKAIGMTAEMFPKEIDEARRGVITDQEVDKLATDLDMSLDDFLETTRGKTLNAEEVIASRRYLNASAENVHKIALAIKGGDNSKVMKVKMLQALDVHRLVQNHISGATAELGRAFRALGIDVGLEGAARNRYLDDLIQMNGGNASVERIADGLADIGGSTSAVSKSSRKTFGRKLLDTVHESWVNSVLSGVTTQGINAVSNMATLMGTIPERKLAEWWSWGSIDGVAKGEAAAMMEGVRAGLVDSFRLAGKAFKTGDSAFGRARKIEMPQVDALSSRNFGVDGESFFGRFLDFIGTANRMPTRLLETSDEFFKGINFRMELHAQAHRKAFREKVAGDLSDEQTQKLIKQYLEKPDDNLTEAAIHAARERTFTKPLEDVKLRGFSPGRLSYFIQDTPILRIVTPFTKTAMNLVEYSLNRTPFAKDLLSDIRAGGVQKDIALSRLSVGMGTMGLAGYFTAQGIVTGRGPSDRRAKKALEAAGWKPYSIRVGNKYYQFDRLDPFGSVMAVGADTAEILASLTSDRENEGQEIAIKAGAIVASLMTPEFLMRNVNDFLDVLNGDEKKTEFFISGAARGLVPLSSFRRDIRKITDPIVRDKISDPKAASPIFDRILNDLRDTIPGMSDSLPAKRNLWGEKAEFVPLLTNPDEDGPLQSSGKDDAIQKEIRRFNMVGEGLLAQEPDTEMLKIDMPPRHLRRSEGGLSETVKLNPHQYDKFVELSAGHGLEIGPFAGITLREYLNEQVKNDYPDLDGLPKTDEAKKLHIKDIISQYRSSAREQLLLEDDTLENEFNIRMEEREMKLSGETPDLRL